MVYRLYCYQVELKVQGYETCVLKHICVIVINNKIVVS